MSKSKKTKLRKRIPPHKRIPIEHGQLTRTAQDLYDLVYSFGLGGCWMSNQTIAAKIDCCIRTVRNARHRLCRARVIVTARTCPHTWIMWSRFHPAVKNCQVLLYPVRQKMDNPYFVLSPQPVGGQKCPQGGAKFAPKLDVRTLTGSYNKGLFEEPANKPPAAPLSQGSAPNPASPSGSTGNRLFRGADGKDSGIDDDLALEASSQLDPIGVILFEQLVKKFESLGYSRTRSISLANARALERRTNQR